MIAIITNSVVSVIFLILAYILYVTGYKKEAILIKNGTFGSLSMYAMLVIIIGLGGL